MSSFIEISLFLINVTNPMVVKVLAITKIYVKINT
jgi:hypothetical protein